MARWIRIIATPPGEAPQHIREAWIGLCLPLIPGADEEPETLATVGVVTGASAGTERGYRVLVIDAINILAREKPFAAAWWKANTPHMIQPGKQFLYAAQVCELLPASK